MNQRRWHVIFFQILLLLAVSGGNLHGQVNSRPFVKKYEAGILNKSYFNSIWPTETGWWGYFSKWDTTSYGNFYYGTEVAIIDSIFEITTRKSIGDTSKYYYDFPFSKKSAPDDQGNFWYWITGYIPADSTRSLYYGKFDANGNILFEKTLPRTTIYDYFYEFHSTGDGNGVFLSTHRGQFHFVTWLTWVDSLGNITYQDSTVGINYHVHHATIGATVDLPKSIILAPRMDHDFGINNTYNIRPKLTRFQIDGPLIDVIDLDNVLHEHYFGNIYNTIDSGYVCWIQEFVAHSFAYEKHRPGIAKFDANFNLEWKKYLFPPKVENEGLTLHQSKRGDFYLIGRHDAYPTDMSRLREWFITKFSPNLDSLWTRFYNIGGDSIHTILQTPAQIHTLDNGNILVLVENYDFGNNYATLYRLDSNGCLISGCNIGDTIPTPPAPEPPKPTIEQPLPILNGQLLAYPNPSNGVWNLEWDVWPGDHSTLKVFDVSGKLLRENPIQREARPSVLDLSDWTVGMYFLEITAESGRVFRTKVLLTR